MAPPPSLILVVGSTGAGKTSYARALEAGLCGQRFSIDDWMTTLFWMDSPQPIQFDWTIERIDRCEAMIYALARDAAKSGRPAILDLGFTTRAHRDKFRRLANNDGLMVATHFLDVPSDQRWQRVEHRNKTKGETFAMHVDRAMFDFMEARFEAPGDDELSGAHDRRIDPATTAI